MEFNVFVIQKFKCLFRNLSGIWDNILFRSLWAKSMYLSINTNDFHFLHQQIEITYYIKKIILQWLLFNNCCTADLGDDPIGQFGHFLRSIH